MSYAEVARLELMNAVSNIKNEYELNEFCDLIAHYFAQKAQAEIDKMWEDGKINEETIQQWGSEHMRTPYRYATHRS